MKRLILISSILTTFALTASAQNKSGGMSFSGVFESAVSATAGAGDADAASYGVEEYANVRMQSRIGDNATFFGAVNLIAAGGNYAVRASSLGMDIDSGQNYTAMIELERLYLRLKSETINFDAGLMRLPFGFSTIWGPSDFLNPKNPLKPDARPRAILGGALSWFPTDDIKLQGFAVTGRDPLAPNSGIAGISADHHFDNRHDNVSIQAIYSLEHSEDFPGTALNPWTHRAGLSVKADFEIGLVMDMLYTHNDNIEDKIDGLAFSAGFDYSLFKAKLVIMAEYLYSGAASSTSLLGGGSFINENYLYAGLVWRFSDFTNAGLALISGIDDASFTPMMTFNHEISQGVSLAAMAQVPVDKDLLFGDGNRGELGPVHPLNPANAGTHFYLETKIKVRF